MTYKSLHYESKLRFKIKLAIWHKIPKLWQNLNYDKNFNDKPSQFGLKKTIITYEVIYEMKSKNYEFKDIRHKEAKLCQKLWLTQSELGLKAIMTY